MATLGRRCCEAREPAFAFLARRDRRRVRAGGRPARASTSRRGRLGHGRPGDLIMVALAIVVAIRCSRTRSSSRASRCAHALPRSHSAAADPRHGGARTAARRSSPPRSSSSWRRSSSARPPHRLADRLWAVVAAAGRVHVARRRLRARGVRQGTGGRQASFSASTTSPRSSTLTLVVGLARSSPPAPPRPAASRGGHRRRGRHRSSAPRSRACSASTSPRPCSSRSPHPAALRAPRALRSRAVVVVRHRRRPTRCAPASSASCSGGSRPRPSAARVSTRRAGASG